jgi:hypothetical protein
MELGENAPRRRGRGGWATHARRRSPPASPPREKKDSPSLAAHPIPIELFNTNKYQQQPPGPASTEMWNILMQHLEHQTASTSAIIHHSSLPLRSRPDARPEEARSRTHVRIAAPASSHRSRAEVYAQQHLDGGGTKLSPCRFGEAGRARQSYRPVWANTRT